MERIFRSFLQSMLKMVNAVGGFAGVAFILYGLWMKWVHSDPTLPWFIYATIWLGVSLSLIACFGHIAANDHCISFYLFLILLLILLETIITAHVTLDKDWEKIFPNDTTGRFNELKNFISSNFEFCKWGHFTIVAAQGMSVFLATILKANDSDDVFAYARQHPSIHMQDSKGRMRPLVFNKMGSKDARACCTIIVIYGIHGQDGLHVTW